MQKKAQTFNTLTNSFRPWLVIKIDGKFECVIVPDRGFPSFFFRVPRALHQSNTPPFLRFFFPLFGFLPSSFCFDFFPSSFFAFVLSSSLFVRLLLKQRWHAFRESFTHLPAQNRGRDGSSIVNTHHLIVPGQKTVKRYESEAFCVAENTPEAD